MKWQIWGRSGSWNRCISVIAPQIEQFRGVDLRGPADIRIGIV